MFYAPFKSTLYRTLWLAIFVSNMGTWIHTVTTSILISQLSTSPAVIALVQTAAMLPIFMFAIPAGIIADLQNRQLLVFYAQIFMAIIAFCMAALSFLALMTPWLLIVMTFLLNIGLAFNQPAWQAVASTLIPKEQIKQAAVLNNLNYNFSRCLGPAIGGIFYASLGPQYLFLINAISFIIVIVIFKRQFTLKNAHLVALSRAQLYQGLQEGLRFFRDFPLLKFLTLKSFCYFLLSSCLWALLPYIVITQNHMNATQLGLLTTSAGIGAIANAYLLYRLRQYFNDNQLTTVAFALSALVIALIATTQVFALMLALMFFFGISWSIAVSVFNGMLQSDFPLSSRSRLIGLYYVFFAGSQAIGGYLSGLAVAKFGLTPALTGIALIASLLFLVYSLKPHLLWHNDP